MRSSSPSGGRPSASLQTAPPPQRAPTRAAEAPRRARSSAARASSRSDEPRDSLLVSRLLDLARPRAPPLPPPRRRPGAPRPPTGRRAPRRSAFSACRRLPRAAASRRGRARPRRRGHRSRPTRRAESERRRRPSRSRPTGRPAAERELVAALKDERRPAERDAAFAAVARRLRGELAAATSSRRRSTDSGTARTAGSAPSGREAARARSAPPSAAPRSRRGATSSAAISARTSASAARARAGSAAVVSPCSWSDAREGASFSASSPRLEQGDRVLRAPRRGESEDRLERRRCRARGRGRSRGSAAPSAARASPRADPKRSSDPAAAITAVPVLWYVPGWLGSEATNSEERESLLLEGEGERVARVVRGEGIPSRAQRRSEPRPCGACPRPSLRLGRARTTRGSLAGRERGGLAQRQRRPAASRGRRQEQTSRSLSSWLDYIRI